MKNNKALKVLSSAALVATLVTPIAAPAVFAASYTSTATATVAPGSSTPSDLGTIKISVDAARIQTTSGDSLIVRLPADFKFMKDSSNVNDNNVVTNSSDADKNYLVSLLSFPAAGNQIATSNGAAPAGVKAEVLSDNEVKYTFTETYTSNVAGASNAANAYFNISLKNIKVPGGANGPVNVAIEGNGGSQFNTGTVTVANIGSGSVASSIDSVKTITTSKTAIDNIRIREDRPGAFGGTSNTVKYKLPTGFVWDNTTGIKANIVDGDNGFVPAGDFIPGSTQPISVSTDDNGRTLVVTSNATSVNKAAYIQLKNLNIKVDDETVAKTGDVEVTVSGKASNSTSSLVVGKYGDYNVKVYSVGDPKTVVGGAINKKIGSFAIEETVAGSLNPGRTITMTLSGNAKWGKLDEFAIDSTQSKNTTSLLNPQGNTAVIGGNGDTLRITLPSSVAATSSAMKAVLKSAKINVSPEAEGDIKVTFGGSAGVTGDLVLAKAQKPVTVKVNGELPKVVLGSVDQAIGDITVTETAFENIDATTSADTLSLTFPQGVKPSLPTAVTVTDGDLTLKGSSVSRTYQDGRWSVNVQTRSTSSKASSIKFSGMKVTTDRTLPEGDLNVEVSGNAVLSTNVNGIFPGLTSVATVAVAKNITPADGKGTVAKLLFKLGATTYTVDGVEKTMDVAPFAQNNRTYLPVRFAAEALGARSVQWDQTTKTATIIKGTDIVQMKLGEKAYYLNGVRVPMDVAVMATPEKRIVLPIRFLGDALNVPTFYNETTNEITLG